MNQKQLLYLGGGFALLLLVWLLFIRDTNPSTIGTLPTIDVPADQVNQLTVAYPMDTVTVERQGGRWVMQRPVTAVADSNTITQLLSQLDGLELDAPITSDLARHAFYGIDTTAARIDVGWADESFSITISRQGPDFQSVYVRLGEDPRIFSTRQRVTVQQNTDRYRDRRIMSQQSVAVQSAIVSRPEGTYEITRAESGWSLNGEEADSMAVETWLRRFATFNADGFHDDIPKQVLQDANHQIQFTSLAGTTEQLYCMPTEDALALASSAKDPTYRLNTARLDTYFPDSAIFLPEE